MNDIYNATHERYIKRNERTLRHKAHAVLIKAMVIRLKNDVLKFLFY